MADFVSIADILIITFGIPFLIAISTYLLKQHLTLRSDLKILEIDFEEYKKLSDSKKNEILKEISIIKQRQKNNKGEK